MKLFKILSLTLLIAGCSSLEKHDVLIKNGIIVDGSGTPPYVGSVAINADTIVAVGNLTARGKLEIDATGLVVAPGFINTLSWATESLIQDGRSKSDIMQGVTLEVFGEGWSMGPLSKNLKNENRSNLHQKRSLNKNYLHIDLVSVKLKFQILVVKWMNLL